jgi:hypothetical protein
MPVRRIVEGTKFHHAKVIGDPELGHWGRISYRDFSPPAAKATDLIFNVMQSSPLAK